MNEVYMREIGRGTTASRPKMTASRPEMRQGATALRPEEMEIFNADD